MSGGGRREDVRGERVEVEGGGVRGERVEGGGRREDVCGGRGGKGEGGE